MAVVRSVDSEASDAVWRPYIQKALGRKGGFDAMMKDLNACSNSEKEIKYSPDGTPAFV